MVVDDTDVKFPKPTEYISSRKHTYEVEKLLGRGGFGAVYLAKNTKDGRQLAMKCEILDPSRISKVLMMDCKVLCGTASIKSPHFCKIVDRGKAFGRFNFLVMTLVGQNLWDLRMLRDGQRYSMSTSLKAALQCMMAIEDLHRVGYLHRDIKPGNYCTGRKETNEHHVIFMLDFGLCRKYVGATEGKDLRLPRETAPFRGTTRYAPIAALSQIEQSRKDDIEAWLYMVVEWTSGSLPWKNLTGKDKAEVLLWKEQIRDDEKCMEQFFALCPKREFMRILQYVFELTYASIPDYGFIYHCITHAIKSMGCNMADPLDWDPHRPYHGPTVEDRNRRTQLIVAEYNEKSNSDPTSNCVKASPNK